MNTPQTNGEKKVGNIVVTNGTIKFSGTVILLQNISRLCSYKSKKNYAAILISSLFAALFALLMLYNLITESPAAGFTYLLLAGTAAYIAVYAYKYKRYGLSIETNGATSNFLISDDEKFATEVLDLLQYALDHIDSGTTYVINMDKLTIKEGDKFDNIYGTVNIATRGSSVQQHKTVA